jgi:cobalt-zinc-cadmium efflux system membrane fusion protein
MEMNKHLAVTLLALLLALSLPLVALPADDHDHDHEVIKAEQHEDHDDHAENSDDDHADHEGEAEDVDHDHDEEGSIELSPEAIKLAGIALSRVEYGRIGKSIDLPGEVGFNEDRLVHVAPRFAGVAKEAHKRIGNYVKAGDVIAVVESNESLTKYSIEAPMSGWIIERHITPGEFVSQESSIYVIADLSTVWVNLAVYPKDAEHITSGQRVTLKAIGSETRTEGTIDYVSPVLDVRTRSITARVVLPNRDNTWRPGTFVQAQVKMELNEECLVVERDAVQILDDEHVVFVAEEEGHFRSIPVVIGESDLAHTRILSGLEKGTRYVASGAFELKAKVVTSSLGAHAGHGH